MIMGIDELEHGIILGFNKRNSVITMLEENGYKISSGEFPNCYYMMPSRKLRGDDIKVTAEYKSLRVHSFGKYFEDLKDGFFLYIFNIHDNNFIKGKCISPFDCLVAFNFGGDKQSALEYLKTL